MTTVPGASRYLNASTLAALRGFSAQTTTVMDGLGVGLLSVGRNNAVPGVGISANARALNEDFLNQSNARANGLFSATAGADTTIEGLQKQILAIRSRMQDSQLAPSLRSDDGGVAASTTGTTVDEEA